MFICLNTKEKSTFDCLEVGFSFPYNIFNYNLAKRLFILVNSLFILQKFDLFCYMLVIGGKVWYNH